MKIRDRINTFLLDFKGDAAAFMLLQEAAEMLAYHEGLSDGFERKNHDLTAELEIYKFNLHVAQFHLSATSSIAQEKIQEVDRYRAKYGELP